MNDFIYLRADTASTGGLLLSIGAALLCGVLIALVYRVGSRSPSKYMTVTSLIIPVIVQTVILLVNGSIGAGIAVAGAFSLVRFRSLPGSSRDICVIFFAMSAGIAAGMGYALYAVLFTVVIGAVMLIAERLVPDSGEARQLKITIPEDMDYNGAFDDIFKEYAGECRLLRVKTIRMGTMYELVYSLKLKNDESAKEMLDKIRCRNGNLTVSIGVLPDEKEEL